MPIKFTAQCPFLLLPWQKNLLSRWQCQNFPFYAGMPAPEHQLCICKIFTWQQSARRKFKWSVHCKGKCLAAQKTGWECSRGGSAPNEGKHPPIHLSTAERNDTRQFCKINEKHSFPLSHANYQRALATRGWPPNLSKLMHTNTPTMHVDTMMIVIWL